MKERGVVVALVLACALRAGAQLSGDAVGASMRAAAERIAAHQGVDRYERLISDRLGWYGLAEREYGIGAEQVAQAVLDGIRQGSYGAVVLGETHGDAGEQEAARRLMQHLLDSGVKLGAFLQEATPVTERGGKKPRQGKPDGIFFADDGLSAARVPILLMDNQFDPDKDVKKALKTAGDGVLVTYTGSAHTSARMRDYIIETLKDNDLTWGVAYPHRPVVEQALEKRGKHPVIVAMLQQEYVHGRIIAQVIRDASAGFGWRELQEELAAAQVAWEWIAGGAASVSGVRFVRSSEQANLYVGFAHEARHPLELAAVREVAALPELGAWLGDGRIKSASAGAFSTSPCQQPRCCSGYQVSVDKGSKQKFVRSVCAEDLP